MADTFYNQIAENKRKSFLLALIVVAPASARSASASAMRVTGERGGARSWPWRSPSCVGGGLAARLVLRG